jgi:hypothetical protein
VLKEASSLKTVCARTVPSVRPSYVFRYWRVVPLGPRLVVNNTASTSNHTNMPKTKKHIIFIHSNDYIYLIFIEWITLVDEWDY